MAVGIFRIFVIFSLIGSLYAMGLDLVDEENPDDRAILLTTGTVDGTIFGVNLTQILPILVLASTALVPALCLCALSILLLWHKFDKGWNGGYGHHSSYSEYSRALGLNQLDWEKLSIIDWMSMGEETLKKFEPTNLSCQTRLVCELHQNAKDFGRFGDAVVRAFTYLRFLEIFDLPQILKFLLIEYREAAERGRSLKKSCGDIYPDCEFSIKEMYDTYWANKL